MDETRLPGEPTLQQPTPAPPRAPDSDVSIVVDAERFAPGVVIAGRYRIISQLGSGGMGEVYRADDQRLGSSVALKFLPVSKSLDPLWRDRLLREVKVARQVTHPNVCRVFDLSDHEGQFFVSMEYIDGEDLSSLLRRIGRFPEDKALEIAQQICLGLAAAHEEGVLHRDLKPANVMLDGRGRIKIADFGLAALTDKVIGPEARSGTLAYMAPEQREGREATRKSDIYSLGLVLYEIFTGRAFAPLATTPFGVVSKAHSATHASHGVHGSHATSSSYVLDVAISRVLARCLKQDPDERPNSAFVVAAALPGGDPLQAALAAGETPSPEMVAEAGGSAVFSKRLLTAALVLFLIGTFATCWLWDRLGVARVGNLSKSPEALTELSRQAIRELGYPTDAVDSAGWLNSRSGLPKQYRDVSDTDEFRRRMKAEHPATWRYTYRQSTRPLAPTIDDFTAFDDNVPEAAEGDVLVKLSGSGRLLFFRIKTAPWSSTTRPALPSSTQPATQAVPPIDVAMLSRLTALPLSEMSAVAPIVESGEQVDERLAWLGKYPAPNDLPVRVEAGRLAGKLIYLNVIAPWDLPQDEQAAIGYERPKPPSTQGPALFGGVLRAVDATGPALYMALILSSGYLATRHLRLGIADLHGGFRLAVFVFAVAGSCWLLWTHFPANLMSSLSHLISGLGSPAVQALVTFAAYIALEPFVRSHWPEKLIAWSRIVDARHRDRLVAGEVLIGLAAGSIARIAQIVFYSPNTNRVLYMGDSSFESFPHAVARFGWQGINGVLLSFLIIFAVALMKRWVGKPWLSFLLAFPIVFVLMNYGYTTTSTWLGIAGFAVPVLIIMGTLARGGLLALVICCCASNVMSKIPMTLSTESYWWTWTATLVGAILALAMFAYQRAMPPAGNPRSALVPA
jgi:serine/threonine-protein kinase